MIKTKTDPVNQCCNHSRLPNVLVVDNDTQTVRLILEILAHKGIHANLAGDKKTALEFLDKGNYDIVFTSEKINASGSTSGQLPDGFELLRKIRTDSPELPVIMIAKNESPITDSQKIVSSAIRAIRAGCCDFLIRPLDREKIENLIDTLLPNNSSSTVASASENIHNLYNIVGRSAKLAQIVGLAKKAAPTSAPVLISGESGTGKELISYLVHHESKRAHGPYIKVNCAALSDSLLESEIFGHEKGAFTGAYAQRKGRFEMAHGGTLLLDEITETSLRFQAKLLRVLEQQDFERVGGNENIKVDVRIISTTNKDLLQETQQGRFRQDLYYRISGVRLVIAPLRERTQDLPDLVWHFVNLYARQVQRQITQLDPAMMGIFAKYSWPGNVRQLRNIVLTSLILGTGPTLSLADVSWLFDELQSLPQENEPGPDTLCRNNTDIRNTQYDSGLGGVPLVDIERQAILDTLRQTSGNQTRAAKVLGISDRTLRDKIRQYRQQGCLQSA